MGEALVFAVLVDVLPDIGNIWPRENLPIEVSMSLRFSVADAMKPPASRSSATFCKESISLRPDRLIFQTTMPSYWPSRTSSIILAMARFFEERLEASSSMIGSPTTLTPSRAAHFMHWVTCTSSEMR
ncbi:MAG: hypothetical protein JWN68_1029 [Nocardioides sp.]|nr:hypothetical protein [Nocardioides sp.]